MSWVSPAAPKWSGIDFIVSCGGYSLQYPAFWYSREGENWLLEKVTKEQGPPPACGNPTDFTWGAVRRGRAFSCPDDWWWYTSDVCYRGSNNLDPPKNLGQTCPPKGECMSTKPINVGVANKFRAESDYPGSGNSTLSFTRYYNSRSHNASNNHLYRDASYDQAFGIGAYASLASNSSEQTGRLGPLGLGAVGVGWRHTYQRSIALEVGTLLTSAYVYRQDAKVLIFTKYMGQWYGQADANIQLQETVDGGGVQNGWKLTLEDGSTETYSLPGKLTTIRSRAGIEQTLAYDGCGRLQNVTDSFGKALSFEYTAVCDPANTQRIWKVTVPGGGQYQYNYDSQGRLTTVTDPDNKTRIYHYENTTFPMALTGTTDESSQRYATYGYDNYGRANLSELAGGADRISIAYPDTGIYVPSAAITVGTGNPVDYTFQIVQGISKLSTQSAFCVGCPVNAKSMSYDANGNISIQKDFNNIETRYGYDLTRNLETSRTEAYGTPKERTITTQWHPTFRLPTQIDEPNRRTTFTHDTSGNVLTRTVTDLTVVPNVARTWTYTYNSFGQVLTEDGPRTDVTDLTTYVYYGVAATCTATVPGATTTGCRGQLNTITNAKGHVTTYNEYNAHGQALKITDPNNVVTVLAYDLLQRLTSSAVGSETTTLEYWPTGLLKKITLPDTSYLQYTYDAAHRLTQVADSQNNRIVYTLDAMGNRTKEETFDPTNYLARLHHRAFNSLNQLWKEIGAANTAAVTTTFGYDLNGNLTSANAPLSRNTTNLYDELNRLKQMTDPGSGITLFGYDANDNLTSVTDPRSKVTSYAYNGFGDLNTQTSPDTGLTANTYDSGGNLKTSTDARSAITTYVYDQLNRPTSAAYKIGTTTDQTITFTYDAGTNGKGRLTGASDANHSMSWVYDGQGRVTSKSQTVGTVTKSVTYGYTNGNLTSMTTPSGQNIAYGYNTNHQVTSITINGTTLLNGVLYDPFGPVRGWTWGNATLSSRTYDTDGKMTQFDSAGLKTYGYDDAFRITGITDTVNSANSYTYGYDLLDRLTSAVKTGTTRGWSYDANGNRLTETGASPSTYTISGTNNRVTSITGALPRTYTYDAAGNVLTYATVTATYNNRGRMKTLKKGTPTQTIVYNALGERVKISGGTPGTVLYWYDEAGHLLGEYSSSGALVQETVWFGDIPVATLRPGTPAVIFYVHADHLNTPRKVSRPSDNRLRWQWEPDPFGTSLPNENPEALGTFKYNLRFPGQIYDAQAGLSYNYFRDYDPATGRYVESDPIGLQGGLNTYAYVGSRPVMTVDPFGLRARVCCRLIPWVGVIGARHCYIERDVGGKRTSWGLIGNEGGPSSEYGDIFIDNGFDTGGACGPWKDDCYTDECVEDAANQYPNPSYYRFARGPNSNTFAGTVARQCGLQRPPFSFGTAPGWYDPQAKQQDGTVYRPPRRITP
jgi:RHS repeat-associated protein